MGDSMVPLFCCRWAFSLEGCFQPQRPFALITVEGLSKIYRVAEKQPGLAGTLRHFIRRHTRDVTAVQDVSFRIEPGEMVGFLGANGAGKTTTLKMLCGLIHPSSGEVQVAGHRPQRRQAEFLRRITLVMGQKQQLLWDLPPMDSLRVNAAVYGIPDAVARRRVNELSDLLELGEELTRPVRKLSLGQQFGLHPLAQGKLAHRPGEFLPQLQQIRQLVDSPPGHSIGDAIHRRIHTQ